MATVAGTLLGETFREERFYRTEGRGHDTWFSTEIELAMEAPAELAGARRRFAMPLGWPVSYARWKGQRVRLTLPQAELARIVAQPESAAAQLPLAMARLELESEKR